MRPRSFVRYKQKCHPDRSETQWDLLFTSTVSNLNGSAALPFVIPTEAKRSGGICSSTDPSWKCFLTERPGETCGPQ